MKNKSILRNLIISYAVIMLIYVGAWLVLQSQAVTILKKQSDTIYSNMLTVISGVVDNEVVNIKKVGIGVAVDPATSSLLDGFRRGDAYDASKMQMVRNKLISVKANAWSIDKIFLYIKSEDKIVSNTTVVSSELFYDYYLMDFQISYDGWMDSLQNITKNGYYIYQGKNGRDEVFFLQPVPVGKVGKEIEGVMAISIAPSAIYDYTRDFQKNQNIKIDILTEDGDYVENSFVMESGDYANYKKIEYVSAETGWTYITYVPLTSLKHQARLFLMMAVGLIISATAIGIVTIWYYLGKSYTPLKELILRMQKAMEDNEVSDNEVDYLWNSFQILVEKQKKDKSRLHEQTQEMKSLFIGQLFHGRAISCKDEEEYFRLFKLQFVKEAFTVVKIFCADQKVQNHEDIFRGDGIYQEQRKLFKGGLFVEKDEYYYLLDASEYAMEELVADLEQFQLFCPCKIIMSSIHMGSEEIAQAYSELLGADNYADMTEAGEIFVYTGDILQEAAWRAAYGEIEKKLVNVVAARQKPEAEKYLLELWDWLYRDGPISAGEIKFLLMGLLNAMLSANGDSETRKIILDSSRKIRFVSGNASVSQMKDIFAETIEELCRNIQPESPKEQILKQQVLDYIDLHFADEDLNVNSICRGLDRSTSSVMKVFEGGKGVLYYINERRILEAKRIILEHNGQIGIAKVTERVGYSNQNTFIRVFKKYEGITPGKFCEMVKRLEQEQMDLH